VYASSRARTRRSLLFSLACALPFLAPTAQGALAQTTVRVGITNVSSDVAFFVAEKKGYFRDEGLNVEILPFSSAARMIAPLGTGQLDVGGGTVSAGLYNAVARGIGLRIVADKGSIRPGYGFSALMVRKDLVDSGRYRGYGDLKGMKIAIGAAGTGTASALNEALMRGGLSYGDADVVEMGFPQHIVAYTNKGIEASITNEPTVTRAVKAGVAVRIAGNDVIYPNQQTAVVLYSEKFAVEQPQIAAKFMKAYIRAARDYNDALKGGRIAGPNADEIIGILTEYTQIKEASVYREISPSACEPNGDVNVESLRKDLAFFKEQKLIEKPDITVDRVIDLSFARRAVKELGPYRPRM
jgi:NitT/TauT family transport system substrate-binding protein